jgi:catechol 2,3-dioxygenase-like lactoylglutathione lyase family enzyme
VTNVMHWRPVFVFLFAQAVCVPSFAQSTTSQATTVSGPVTGLAPDHATLSVANIEREAEWYERVLGFKPFSKSEANPDFRNWHLVIPGYRIDLVQFKGSRRQPPLESPYLQQGWTHVVFHVEDVQMALRQLQALNVDVVIARDNNGVPIQLRIRDPEGNEVEIRRNLLV